MSQSHFPPVLRTRQFLRLHPLLQLRAKRLGRKRTQILPIDVVMPALEMAQDSALLLRWAKKEGEYVAKGDVLMEIETDKATVEIEATGSGILSRVSANAGDQVP